MIQCNISAGNIYGCGVYLIRVKPIFIQEYILLIIGLIGLSIGNLIGSNIFDFLIPVRVGASISEIKVDKMLIFFDLPLLFTLSILVFFFFCKKRGIKRTEAIILIAFYGVYGILKKLRV